MMPREVLTIVNPNRGWVVDELDRLIAEWRDWLAIAESLRVSSDFIPMTCSEAVKDGFSNRRKHEVLREKTLVFIGNNFTGYAFLFENWPTHPHEANTSRLAQVIPSWLHRLGTLSACIDYARVTDGFWTARGKRLVDDILKAAPDKAGEIAIAFLKNPLGIGGG